MILKLICRLISSLNHSNSLELKKYFQFLEVINLLESTKTRFVTH